MDVAEVLDPIRQAFENEARTKGLDFRCEVDPWRPDGLKGDAGRIRQVVYNLVGNAMKYTESGGVLLEAFLLPGGPPGVVRLHLAVSDTGIGVPGERLKDIFEAFTQVDGSYTRRYGGAGLGLAIVKRLVGLMGGHFSFCSRPGEGSLVEVVLPLRTDGEGGEAKPAARPAAGRDPGAGLEVLVCEDDQVNSLTVTHMLAKAGHRAHEAATGVEALAFLSGNEVDCVLMDIQMPEMDGVEATRRIRAGEAGEAARSVIIIALTAHAMKGDRETFLEAGMDGYIAKPVDMAELERVLMELAHGAPGGERG
jgi:CheY-like chemotaxis protein/anti-sigma regulatory factor (Ser/Thr protein kinase)